MMRKKLIGSKRGRLFGSRPKSDLLAVPFNFSEGGFQPSLIAVYGLYGLEDSQALALRRLA
jgi:hypothetical protein